MKFRGLTHNSAFHWYALTEAVEWAKILYKCWTVLMTLYIYIYIYIYIYRGATGGLWRKKTSLYIYIYQKYQFLMFEIKYPRHSCFSWKHMTNSLTLWGRVTHICVGRLNIIGSDNGLARGRRQAIILTNAVISLIGASGTNFSEIGSQTFHYRKCIWKCRLRNGVCLP